MNLFKELIKSSIETAEEVKEGELEFYIGCIFWFFFYLTFYLYSKLKNKKEQEND